MSNHKTMTAGLIALCITGCSRGFTDKLGSKGSPDGRLRLAATVEDHGFGSGTTYGITIGPKDSDPLTADAILTWGEDERPIQYRWNANDSVTIRLPCGMWGNARNSYQQPGTSQIVRIYFAAPWGCPYKPDRYHGGGFTYP